MLLMGIGRHDGIQVSCISKYMYMYNMGTIAHMYSTCKSYKSFPRGLRSGEAAGRPWEMTYN